MPNVVFVLALEDQPPVRVVLLGRAVQLSVHVGALEHAPVLVRVDALALQRVVRVVALQGAARKGRTQGRCQTTTGPPGGKGASRNAALSSRHPPASPEITRGGKILKCGWD